MRKIYSKIYILGILEKAKSHPLETYDFSAVVAVIISKEIFNLKKNENNLSTRICNLFRFLRICHSLACQ